MGSLSETISPSPRKRVRDALDDVLDRFERARLEGEPLEIEDVLGQLSPTDVATAIGQLVEIDAEYRLDSFEAVSAQMYCDRFPEHVAAVEDALRRLSEGREGLEPRFRLRNGVRLNSMVVGTEVGRGGVAVVYRVIDGLLRRPLALKTVLEERMVGGESVVAYRSESRWRLQQEAAITAKLSHPGVPPVHSAGELPDGRPYFCMRLIEGETFACILQREPSDLTKHLRILAQVAQILSAAHQQLIIHRDVKPGNVMVGKYGEVQLMDWGMGKQLPSDYQTTGGIAVAPGKVKLPEQYGTCDTVDLIPDSPRDSVAINTSIAMDGDSTSKVAVLGTLAYMPPEQAHGLTGIHNCSTDVFALGAILCQILTGFPPYYAETSREVWKKACDADLADAFNAIRKSPVDSELKQLAISCLSSEQDLRPRDASQVAKAMQAYFESVEQRIEVAKIERAQALTLVAAERTRAKLEIGRRRIAVALCCSLVALFAIAATFWYVTESQRMQANLAEVQHDIDRSKSLVQALLVAAPEGVPYAIESLRPLAEYAHANLEQSANDLNLPASHRLHAAMAQLHFGGGKSDLIVNAINTAAAAELPNIVEALKHDSKEAQRLLHEYAQPLGNEKTLSSRQARVALVLLMLGDDSLLVDLSADSEATKSRLLLIQTFREWRGATGPLASYLRQSKQANSRAIICQALASREMTLDEAQEWQALLSKLAANEPNAYLHSAVTYLSVRWALELKPNAVSDQKTLEWKTTISGLTMMAIPKGSYKRQLTSGATQDLEVTRPYWIGDREVPASVWAKFLEEAPPAADSQDAASEFKTPDTLARSLSWDDAIHFCNWLSTKEGFKPCYTSLVEEGSTKPLWKWDQSADGYRLPTEIEWEWAARICHPDAPLSVDELSEFIVFGQPEPSPSISRLPNRFGLFEGQGNLHEWCFDAWEDTPATIVNHEEPAGTYRHVVRGGSFRYSPGNFGRELRSYGSRTVKYHEHGLRLAQSREDHSSQSPAAK